MWKKLSMFQQGLTESANAAYGSGHEGAAVLLPGFAIKW